MNNMGWCIDLFNREIERCAGGMPREERVWRELKERAGIDGDPEFRDALSAIAGRRDRARILDILVAAAMHWNPEKMLEKRNALRRIEELDAEIAESAKNLSKAIRTRADIRERNGIGKSMSEFDIPLVFPRLFEKYAESDQPDAYLCRMWLMKELQPLISRFDWKYWPTLPDLLDVVAVASFSEVDAGQTVEDGATLKALSASRQASVTDFVRAFLHLLEESRDINRDWRNLTNLTLASLMNAALSNPETSITPGYLGRIRKKRTTERFFSFE